MRAEKIIICPNGRRIGGKAIRWGSQESQSLFCLFFHIFDKQSLETRIFLFSIIDHGDKI